MAKSIYCAVKVSIVVCILTKKVARIISSKVSIVMCTLTKKVAKIISSKCFYSSEYFDEKSGN